MFKKAITIVLICTAPLLGGCLAAVVAAPVVAGGAMLAKMGLGAKPKMNYVVNGREIVINVSTYSANLTSVKNMTEVGAALVADEVLRCPYLAMTYAKWPNNLLQAAVRIDSVVTYECTSKTSNKAAGLAGAVGSVVDVKKKLRFEQDLVSIIRTHQLLNRTTEEGVIRQ